MLFHFHLMYSRKLVQQSSCSKSHWLSCCGKLVAKSPKGIGTRMNDFEFFKINIMSRHIFADEIPERYMIWTSFWSTSRSSTHDQESSNLSVTYANDWIWQYFRVSSHSTIHSLKETNSAHPLMFWRRLSVRSCHRHMLQQWEITAFVTMQANIRLHLLCSAQDPASSLELYALGQTRMRRNCSISFGQRPSTAPVRMTNHVRSPRPFSSE